MSTNIRPDKKDKDVQLPRILVSRILERLRPLKDREPPKVRQADIDESSDGDAFVTYFSVR